MPLLRASLLLGNIMLFLPSVKATARSVTVTSHSYWDKEIKQGQMTLTRLQMCLEGAGLWPIPNWKFPLKT